MNSGGNVGRRDCVFSIRFGSVVSVENKILQTGEKFG